MAQHAIIDADGAIQNFLDDQLHKVIPAGAVTLTADQYAQWLTNQKGLRWDAASSSLVAVPVTVPVPKRVSRYQFKSQLLTMPGAPPHDTLFSEVSTWIAGQGGAILLAWTDQYQVPIDGAFMKAAIAQFGWTSAQVDQMFIAAVAIPG